MSSWRERNSFSPPVSTSSRRPWILSWGRAIFGSIRSTNARFILVSLGEKPWEVVSERYPYCEILGGDFAQHQQIKVKPRISNPLLSVP